MAPRVLPVGREAGQEVALATVRGPGRRGAPDAAAPVGLVVALPLGTRETKPGLGASFRKQPE